MRRTQHIIGYRRNGAPIWNIMGGDPSNDPPKIDDMTPDQARTRRDEVTARMREINSAAGENDLNDEQRTEWEKLDDEHTKLTERIDTVEREQREAERRQRVEDSRRRWGSTQFSSQVDPDDGAELRGLRQGEVRDRSLKRLDKRETTEHWPSELRDERREKLERVLRTRNADLDGAAVGRLLLATETPEYHSAFMKAMHSATPAFTVEEARAVELVRAMSIGTDTAGGFAVPVVIDPTLILTEQGSLNPFRRIARVETITTDTWKGVTSAGSTWSYDTEGSRTSDDSPTIAQPEVPAHTARGSIPYSLEVGSDWPGFAENMGRALAEGYDELQAESFATGSGSDEPTGILTALDANTNVEVVVTSDGVFQGADINKVWGALPDRWKSNATWVQSHDVGNEIASFGNSNNLSFVTVDLTGELQTIRMRPVAFASYFPDFTGTTGDANILVVGDWRNFLIAERAGMSVEFIPHLFQQETAGAGHGMPTGQRAWFAWARHGSDSINDLGFRLLQNQGA